MMKAVIKSLVDDILAFLAPIRHPERLGKPNAQIAYTDDEIQVAKLARQAYNRRWLSLIRDVTSDGGGCLYNSTMTHSHWIKKDSLSEAERAAARFMLKRKVWLLSTDHQESEEYEAKGQKLSTTAWKQLRRCHLIVCLTISNILWKSKRKLDFPHYDHTITSNLNGLTKNFMRHLRL